MSESFPAFPGRSHDFVEYATAKNWIGGRLVDAQSGKTMPVLNPRHGQAMGNVVLSDAADVQAAVEAAKAALPAWKATPIKERSQVLFKFKHLAEQAVDELSWLVCHENGKSFGQAKASVVKGIECVEMGASLQNMMAGGQLDVSRGVNCEVNYEPMGICGGIVPFNFPFMVPLWMLPQALVAGNAFILKPSEQVPYSALRIAALMQEAGLPDGILNLIQGARESVEGIVDHPDIKAVGFVGSTRVAKLVYARGSALGKRMLCLGGAKNHLVVVPDADAELTAENVVASAYGCAGQRCMAASVLMAVGDVQGMQRVPHRGITAPLHPGREGRREIDTGPDFQILGEWNQGHGSSRRRGARHRAGHRQGGLCSHRRCTGPIHSGVRNRRRQAEGV